MDFNPATAVAGLAISSHDSKGRLAEVVFSNYANDVFSWPSAAPSTSSGPTSFTVYSVDIGNINGQRMPSSVTLADSTNRYTIETTGADIWNNQCGFHFIPFKVVGDFIMTASFKVVGDFTMTAYVESLDGTHQWAKAGIMVRDSLAPGSIHVSVLMGRDHGFSTMYREDANQATSSMGLSYNNKKESGWVKIERTGSTFKTYYKIVGSDPWEHIGDIEMPMSDPVEAGIAVSSHDNNSYVTAVVSNFELDAEPYRFPSASPTITPAPSTTNIPLTDIGNVNLAGSGSFAVNSGKHTMRASGSDIWNSVDGFSFIHETKTGDMEVVAYIEHMTAPHEWTKAGIMIREGLEGNARNVAMLLNPNNGFFLQHRDAPGAATSNKGLRRTPMGESGWVKLVRMGNQFTGSYSSDGLDWTLITTTVNVQLPATVEVGLVLTSHTNSAYADATFQHYEAI
eukprot:CAMPEP_0116546686 /NCGR_PEP_ID=MMETSP0397-20121206/3360_1 /TAXON_ID=216820 /ORGANISM="Cyclophora tenuis, Strain ECT3854" /LENGTH=453 /DNA_ID=CAMNT_0004071135 /DNA_START=1 /DNA_END=1363 /DNA_ORIENTATION=+